METKGHVTFYYVSIICPHEIRQVKPLATFHASVNFTIPPSGKQQMALGHYSPYIHG